jgi:hypothetical protein
LGKHMQVILQGHMINVFNFMGNFQNLSNVAVSLYIPTSSDPMHEF